MHDRLLRILLASIESIPFDLPVYLWFTPKIEAWNISEVPSFDRRHSKVKVIDRANAQKSISDFLYEQQPPYQNS
jgi:hypothetical protein